jgi:hypothetical protein
MFDKSMSPREKLLTHLLLGLIFACCVHGSLAVSLSPGGEAAQWAALAGQRAWMVVAAVGLLWIVAAAKLEDVTISCKSRGVIETACFILAVVSYAFGPGLF